MIESCRTVHPKGQFIRSTPFSPWQPYLPDGGSSLQVLMTCHLAHAGRLLLPGCTGPGLADVRRTDDPGGGHHRRGAAGRLAAHAVCPRARPWSSCWSPRCGRRSLLVAEALVGLIRLALITLAGLPLLIVMVAMAHPSWEGRAILRIEDIPWMLIQPFIWGAVTGTGPDGVGL